MTGPVRHLASPPHREKSTEMPKLTGASLDEHRRLMRERLFASFSGLVAQHGYGEVSLADVAEGADLSRTTIYNYFPDKAALVVAMAEERSRSLEERLTTAVGAASTSTEKLRTFVAEQLRLGASDPLPPDLALRAVVSERARLQLAAHTASLEQLLRDILADGVADGSFAPQDLDLLIPLVNACTAQLLPSDLSGSELDDAIEATETFVLRAVGARQPHP